MKNTLSLLLLVTVLLFFSSCKKDIVKSEWEQYCEETALGGEVNLTIDGENWATGCVQAIYTETTSADYSSKILWVYAYNYGSTFYNGSDIEVFYAAYVETTSGGVTETESTAVFVDDFFTGTQSSNTSEGNYFSSDPDMTSTDAITISQITSDKATGTMSFKLFNDNNSEEISVTGSFEAVIQN